MKYILVFILGALFSLTASFGFKSYYAARYNYFYNQALKSDPTWTKFPNLSSRLKYVREQMHPAEHLIQSYLEEDSNDCFGPMNPGGPMPAQCGLVHKIYKSVSGEKP